MGNFGYSEVMLVALAVLGSAIIKNSVGIGAGIFLLPFLALVFAPKLALGLGAPAMLISDVVGLRNYWKEWNREELAFLIPPAVMGVFVGAIIIKLVPDAMFKFGVGTVAVLFSSYHLGKSVFKRKAGAPSRIEHPGSPRKYVTILFGFLGGTASTVIHAGGMVMSIYLFQRPVDKRRFVGTLVFFFAVLNLLKLGAYLKIGIMTAEIAFLAAAISPVIIVGGVCGNFLNRRFPQDLFRAIVLLIIFFIGMRLLLTGY
ncbi:MAG: sulfite exporter TauE/SafE family protein [Deltaproteobacteria bacterium]|nr:sulfite exporter TauE/SafE family protein [Deltaproteobacteria bacterium]